MEVSVPDNNLKNPVVPFRNTVEPCEYGRHQWANDLAVLTGDRINEGFFFLQESVWSFCRAAKTSDRNNEVTRITEVEVAVRRGSALDQKRFTITD